MKGIRVCRYLLVFIVMWGLSNGASGAAAEGTVIKVALITPEGSAWTNSLYQLAAAVKERTKGAVTFTVYAGGIAGDELDVLRKMQADRIQAAGFSGVGLGVLVQQIRILEAPLLYKTEAEVDFVKQKLADR
ncbi:MAG: TRAP transporter substrate-binding protein DctP, partial [Desulfobacterales bacterium]